jgi:hypothetical protein
LSFFEPRLIGANLSLIEPFFEPKPKKLPFSRLKKAQYDSKRLKKAQNGSENLKKFELIKQCLNHAPDGGLLS